MITVWSRWKPPERTKAESTRRLMEGFFGGKIPPAVATAAPSPDDDEPTGEIDWYEHAQNIHKELDK